MVFSSLPLYHHLDSSNWHQQSNEQHHHHHQQLLISAHHHQQEANGGGLPNHGGGGGGVGGGGSGSSIKPNSMVDRARQAQIPLPEAGQKCPRCESTNTKFCYFNNYSLSQPRHFCKTCRRYWTRGGALRNVPVGGGSRRTTKRSKGRSSTTSSGGNNNNSNVSSGSSRSPMIGGGGGGSVTSGGSSCSTSLFLTPNNMPQFPFLPSSLHHHLGNSNPNGIGLSLLGGGGAEMEFPFMGSFEGLGKINGMMQNMHPFENSTTHGSVELLGGRLMPNHHPAAFQPKPLDPEVLDRVASVKLEDSQRLNLVKDFEVIQPTNEHQHHQYNWNNSSVWTTSDLSDYNSPSSTSHHLLG